MEPHTRPILSFLFLFILSHSNLSAKTLPKIDPIRFTISTEATYLSVNEEFEIKITAKYLSINPNLVYVFDGANAFKLKLVMPAGFKQTSGSYSDFVGAELTSAKPSVTYTVRGRFISDTHGGTFQLLRSHKNAGSQSEFVQVGTLAFSTLSANADTIKEKNARIAVVRQEYISYMNLSAFRAGVADTSKVIYINDGLKSGIFRLDTTNTTSTDDSVLILTSGNKRFMRQIDGYVNTKWLSADLEGSFFRMISTLGESPSTILINQIIPVKNNVTIPKNINLVFENGGGFLVDSGKIINIKGGITAQNFKIFYGPGFPSFTVSGNVNSHWFGLIADYNYTTNTGTDNTAALQKTVDFLTANGGGGIQLPIGYVLVNGTVYINPLVSTPISIVGSTEQHKQLDNTIGSTIFRNVSGDIFRINTKSDGSANIAPPNGYTGFSAKNFSIRGRATEIKVFNMFRTRSHIENLSVRGCDYLVYQPATDNNNIDNYCDLSTFRKLTIMESTLGGLRLEGSDASIVEALYMESPTATTVSLLDISHARGLTVDGILFWSSSEYTMPPGSKMINIYVSSSVQISNLHIERCYLENVFYINASRAISITGLYLTFVHNNVFHIRNSTSGVMINTWHSNATKNTGMWDIITTGTDCENIQVNSPRLENGSLVKRKVEISDQGTNPNAIKYSSVSNYEGDPLTAQKDVIDYNDILGDRHFTTIGTPANSPAPALGVGIQLRLNGSEFYKRQLINVSNDWYKRTSSAGVFSPYYKILDAQNYASILDPVYSKVAIYNHPSDLDYTIPTGNSIVFLPAITTNRLLTLPAASTNAGKRVTIVNTNNQSHTWNTNVSYFVSSLPSAYFLTIIA